MKPIVCRYLFSWKTHTIFCEQQQETHVKNVRMARKHVAFSWKLRIALDTMVQPHPDPMTSDLRLCLRRHAPDVDHHRWPLRQPAILSTSHRCPTSVFRPLTSDLRVTWELLPVVTEKGFGPKSIVPAWPRHTLRTLDVRLFYYLRTPPCTLDLGFYIGYYFGSNMRPMRISL